MKSNFASGVLSALLYCQALLLFAGLASVLMRDRSESPPATSSAAIHGSVHADRA